MNLVLEFIEALALLAMGSLAENTRATQSLPEEVDLGRQVEWGLGVCYVDELNALVLQIPSYTELEAKLAWKPNRHCELAVVGNNLLHARHREFNPVIVFARDVQVDRAVYAKVTFRF